MPPKMHAVGLPARAHSNKNIALLDDPPLGHLQFLILHKLDELAREAHGYNVLEQLSLETGVWLDHAAVYGTIRKLLDRELIELAETRPQRGAPPFKIYRLTGPGRAALKGTIAHYDAMAAYIKDKSKTARS